ncbi:ABC transporter permease [Pseudomonas costantinii]|uniref:ABC transporter permease n=1 Tax=Pseudomonas costantinii TaxID=168469 RepID=UPI0015A0A126|nr:ABC transporter permease [Pseudomonas costantinii]
MRLFISFFVAQCVLASRSRIALFWSFVYPVAMLLLMLSVFGGSGKSDATGSDPRLITVTGVYVLTMMSGGIFALATVLSADLHSGIYKRLKLTDLQPAQVLAALILRQFVTVILGMALVYAGSTLLFSVTPHGNFFAIAFLTVVATVLFCSIGLIIANLCAHPPTATAIANAIFLVMLFLSGSTFPKAFFPGWLINAAQVLPASHLFDLLEAQLYYNEGLTSNMPSLVVLLAMCLVLFVIAVKTFKWK